MSFFRWENLHFNHKGKMAYFQLLSDIFKMAIVHLHNLGTHRITLKQKFAIHLKRAVGPLRQPTDYRMK